MWEILPGVHTEHIYKLHTAYHITKITNDSRYGRDHARIEIDMFGCVERGSLQAPVLIASRRSGVSGPASC